MIVGDFIDQVLHAEAGQPPYEWEVQPLPAGLQYASWGRVYGVAPNASCAKMEVDLSLRDARGNQAFKRVPLRISELPELLVGFRQTETGDFIEPDAMGTASPFRFVPGGRFFAGYHASPGREHWLRRLDAQGFAISPQLARSQWPAGNPHVNGFLIQKYEVTNREYASFVRDVGHPAPGHWPGGAPPQGQEHHPVVCVSYDDAMAYCKWKTQRAKAAGLPYLLYRLPTHWEWEKAARGPAHSGADPREVGGAARLYPWHDYWGSGFLHALGSGVSGTVAVTARPGVSPYGVCDLAGNVSEWVDGGEVRDGRVWKHVRGASWRKRGERYGLTFFFGEELYDPRRADDDVGFRCVVEVLPEEVPEQALVPLGNDRFIDGRGQHQFIGRFYMARFAVSNEEFRQFRSGHQFDPRESGRPVVGISYQDAQAFCQWKSQQDGRVYQLPTREEWERACRGTDGRVYPWGNTYSRYHCNSLESGWGRTVDVWALWEGATPDGIYNLCGNTFEWIQGGDAIGGSWLSSCEGFGAPPYESSSNTFQARPDIGFRYVTH